LVTVTVQEPVWSAKREVDWEVKAMETAPKADKGTMNARRLSKTIFGMRPICFSPLTQ
jgi:hypothetical protein